MVSNSFPEAITCLYRLTMISRHQPRLLQLPRELLVDIISALNFRDVYTLRLVNRELHNLIHENESAIVRQYLAGELEPLQEFFRPSGPLSLSYLGELLYRARESSHLSLLLADRCCEKLESRLALDNKEVWREGKRKKLKDKLMMSLFALHEFLVRFRNVVLRSLQEFEGWLTADSAAFRDILGLDQQRILETFPAESLVHIEAAWLILAGVAHSKGIPLGCKSTKYPYTTVRVLLVIGGLDRFTALMNKPNPKERTDDLDAFNAELWQGQMWKPHPSPDGPLLNSVHHLTSPPRPVSSGDFPRTLSPTASIRFINSQHICDISLVAVILRTAGNLDGISHVEQYICDAVKEEGDAPYILPSWRAPDNPP